MGGPAPRVCFTCPFLARWPCLHLASRQAHSCSRVCIGHENGLDASVDPGPLHSHVPCRLLRAQACTSHEPRPRRPMKPARCDGMQPLKRRRPVRGRGRVPSARRCGRLHRLHGDLKRFLPLGCMPRPAARFPRGRQEWKTQKPLDGMEGTEHANELMRGPDRAVCDSCRR